MHPPPKKKKKKKSKKKKRSREKERINVIYTQLDVIKFPIFFYIQVPLKKCCFYKKKRFVMWPRWW
jgi:hypothetical protein